MSLPPGKVIEDDPPVPVQGKPASEFSGRGAFTAWNWEAALRLKGVIDWVAVQADEVGNDMTPIPDRVTTLRAAGFDVHAWYSWDHPAAYSFTETGATGFIGQAESAGQLELALRVCPGGDAPLALVSNVTSFDKWPAGWYCLGESYVNADPAAKPNAIEFEARKRGAIEFSPVYGCYDASAEQPGVGRRVPVAEYLAKWPYKDWALYLAETLEDSDVDYLRRAYPA